MLYTWWLNLPWHTCFMRVTHIYVGKCIIIMCVCVVDKQKVLGSLNSGS